MSPLKASLVGAAVIAAALIVFFFGKGIFFFLENFRAALISGGNGELSYSSLLDFKLATKNTRSGEKVSSSAPAVAPGFASVEAEVFSDYPFNNFSRIAIAAGSDKGLKPGMPVFEGGNVLLGKILSVGSHKSEVETFFDPSWKSSVFIGDGKIKGLLSGGSSPYVDFIPKGSNVSSGMQITNSDSAYPINSLIGSVDAVESVENDLWLRATVRVPFDLSNVNDVFVVINFD